MFFKICILKHFAIFTGKHLCWSLFFNEITGFRLATLLRRRLQHRCFPANIGKFLRAALFPEHLRWLVLKVGNSVLYIYVLCFFKKSFKVFFFLRKNISCWKYFHVVIRYLFCEIIFTKMPVFFSKILKTLRYWERNMHK